jgi:hypothetical protein
MKSRAHASLSRIAATISVVACGVWCLAGVALAAPAARQLPTAGDGFAVSLTASSPYAPIGHSVTLTATTNADVGPTPYFISIYSETTGAQLAICGFGTTCTATVAQGTLGTQTFEAFVGDDVPGTGHPGFTLVSSNEEAVGWWFILRWQPSRDIGQAVRS